MPEPDFNRRTFLSLSGASVAALAAGCATPGKIKAEAGPKHPRVKRAEQIGVAVIGLGIRGRSMVKRYLLEDERVHVVAVCDVDKTRRDDGKKFVDAAYATTDCAVYVDYREVLSRTDVDAVVIATPDHWHTTQVIHAAAAKKDIYCEKPLTHTLLEGKRIIDAVNKHGVVFQTGSQQRTEFGKKFVKAVEYVRNGRIGKVLTANVGVGPPSRAYDLGAEDAEPGLDWDRWLGPAAMRPYNSVLSPRGVHRHYPKWRHFWDFAGGSVADMGAHHFDIVQWALDRDGSGPVLVVPPEDEDALRGAYVQYDDGVKVFHGGPSGATIIGEKGMIHVDRGRISSTPKNILEKPIAADEKTPDVFTIQRFKHHFDDWIRCIASREKPTCPVEVGASTAAVCQLLNLAYRYRRRIAWDPVTWQFADDTPASYLDYDRRSAYPLPAI